MKKKKEKDFFILTLRKSAIILILWISSIFLHNLFFAIFGIEDIVFFIIAVFVIPLYFVFSVIYTILKKIKKRKK